MWSLSSLITADHLRVSLRQQEFTAEQSGPPGDLAPGKTTCCAVYGASSALHVVGSFRARTIWETLRKISPPT